MLRKFIILLSFVFLFSVSCSQNTEKKGGTALSSPVSPNTSESKTQNSHPSPASVSGSSSVSAPENILPEIAAKYDGVVIAVIKKSDKSEITAEIPFGKLTEIKNTPFSINVLSLFTNFKMSNGTYINASMSEENPAALVKIYKNGIEVFNRWLYQKFPGTHGMDDPDYEIIMVSSILKK